MRTSRCSLRGLRRKPLLTIPEQEELRGVRGGRHVARQPRVIVNIHVSVVLDVTAEGTVEVPEPVRAEHMPAWPPEGFVAAGLEARTREHHLRHAADVEGEVLQALQERRRLDHEQRVMIARTDGPHERPYSREPIRRAKADARIELLGFRGIGNEQHDVRQRARHDDHVRPHAELIQRTLRWRARGVGQVGLCGECTPLRAPKAQPEAHVV